MSLAKLQKDLCSVLRYTEELVGLNERVILDLSAEQNPVLHEASVASLEGIDFNVDDETWMRLRRLRETQPPEPDPMFEGWVKLQSHPSPDKAPALLEHRMLRLPIEDISDLAEAGLIEPDDVMRPLDADEVFPSTMDVILRTHNMPEFRKAWQAYIDGPWAKWAEVERPRRRSIDVYNKLYQIQQRVTAAGEDNALELVWGIGVARWQLDQARIDAPVLEQLVELELTNDGTLLVVLRQVPPQLSLKPFHVLQVQGSNALQRDAGKQLERIVEDPDVVFSPFERKSFESLLKSCASRLSASGAYLPDVSGRDPNDRSLLPVDGTLRISDTWAIYVRHRSEDFRKDDIRKLIKEVENAKNEKELPPPGLRFVKPPSDEPLYNIPDGGSGYGGGNRAGDSIGTETPVDETPAADQDLFFPLPYNDEQREILRRLEEEDGVVVQGPPGTGKTHTIANVICHYLAKGKRVLVTAKTAEALTALHDKLPPGISKLAISVIHNDREGARQLEQAVRVLANEANLINPKIVMRDLVAKQGRIANIQDRIAAIDKELLTHARLSHEEVEFRGQRLSPLELAKRVIEDRAQHAWFEDRLGQEPGFQPRFSNANIREAREARLRLGDDLAYAAEDLPDPDALPELVRVLTGHRELARFNEIEKRSRSGETLHMAVDAVENVHAVHLWLKEFHSFFEEARAEAWLVGAYQSLVGARRADAAALAVLKRMLDQRVKLHERGRAHALRGTDPGNVPVEDHAFDAAITALARGEKPFGIFSFGKSALKERIVRVKVGGSAPSSPADWHEVKEFRTWQREALAFLRQWSAICSELGLPSVPTDWESGRAELLRLGQLIASLLRFASEAHDQIEALRKLFPLGLDARAAIHEGKVGRMLEALAANLEKAELADAHAVRDELLRLAGKRTLPFHSALADFASALGNASVADGMLADAWQRIREEATRLAALRPLRLYLDKVVDLVRRSGAPLWADRLLSDQALDGTDPWTPEDWRDSWEWARADGFIRSIGDGVTIQRLADERSELEAQRRKLLAEVVQLMTFLGLKKALTGRVVAAFAVFAAAIAQLGAGTGRSAGRHRRVIRQATLDAADAVPCWILPEWRVSEQLPAKLNAFDLVIIDEASQSDVTAIHAVLRGRKLLIVGDDKQVSPSHVGLEQRQIIQLRTTYLTGLPFADQMEPLVSLYELGGMLFPGKTILLRDHFRCVEPIIRFSSRFYDNKLVPMRLPTATERLDPPLVDILVRDGEKKNELNKREAEVIVEKIRSLTEDPGFEKRTIGVISLIGTKQANLIYNRLMRELGAEVVERHRIMCGNAATFQGQERDIVFLSMVACPRTASTQRSRLYEQRFNVAMSRARDRLVLVRSVTSSDLKPSDLKFQVIEHFRNPMGQGQVAQHREILDACDSPFEKEFGARLLDLGYRIRPQVPVAGFRIDFVIEGAEDRRLAVELDGDKWHGPDRWAEDFRRQNALERLGWTFWRCWGSNWVADPEACLADLRNTLERMGIEPLGAEPLPGVWTKFQEVGGTVQSVQEAAMLVEAPPIKQHALDFGMTVTPGRPVSAEVAAASAATVNAADETESSGFDEAEAPSLVVEPGDLVTVRYDDALKRPVRVRLSKTEHKPSIGTIHVSEPLAKALLGCAEEEEFEVVLKDGKTRIGVIERIERDTVMAA